MKHAVKFDGKFLSAQDISGRIVRVKFDNIYLVGAGKAALGMAEAVVSILKGKAIADGAINVPAST